MMTKGSRILVLVAALALGLVYVLPMWRISLEAPQYPEGLGMRIHINTIVGQKPNDLGNINNLNHYIGMKRIVPESIPELKIMPVVMGVLMLLGLLAAATGRRKVLYAWVGVYVLVSAVGLVDFWKWEYDYGHDLDQERAIIKIPGMSYQPPLIGKRQILNFTARSWPGAGGWIAIGVGALAAGLALAEMRRARRARAAGDPSRAAPGADAVPLAALVVATAVGLGGCSEPRPRALAFGADRCAQCLMGLADEGHGAELLTRTGRAYVFDSVECLVAYLQALDDPGVVRSLWVTDFSNPPELIEAGGAHYLASSTLSSPMGLGLTAFARAEDRDGAAHAFGGEPLDWAGVRALVAERWPGGQPAHGGHPVRPEPAGPADAPHGSQGG